MTMEKLLRLNLQTFASADNGSAGTKEVVNDDDVQDDTKGGDGDGVITDDNQTDDVKGDDTTDDKKDEKLFTQEDVDRLIKKRLERREEKAKEEQERVRKEAEKEKLKENEEFKELAESYRAELDEMKAQVIENQKEQALIKQGFSEDQVERYLKYIDGSDKEEIEQSVKELSQDIAPKRNYVDPSAGNSAKGKQPKLDDTEIGTSMYEKIKNKIRK